MKKKTSHSLRLFLLLLTVMLILTSCVSPQAEERVRRTVHFDEMQYERPDIEEMKETLQQITEDLKAAPDFNTALLLDKQKQEQIENLKTMRLLANIHRLLDMSDEYYDAEYRTLKEALVDISLLTTEINRELVEGDFANEYREEVGEHYFEYLQRSLLYESESVAEYKKELIDLTTDYENMITMLTVEYEGQDYTYIDLFYERYNPQPEIPLYQLIEQYYDEHLTQYVEIFAEIIRLNKLIADELGFESVSEMMYSLEYIRDYGHAEMLELFRNIKQYIVPLVPLLYDNNIYTGVYDLEVVLEVMPEALGALDTGLRDAWEFMQNYGLYDIETSPNKANGAFVDYIYDFDAPFIFSNWSQNQFYELSTLLHEMGHFYELWLHYGKDIMSKVDSSEIYSQTMELLMQSQYHNFIDDPEIAQRFSLSESLLTNVLYQSALEEFQLQVYEMDHIDAATLGHLFAQLYKDYGFGYSEEGDAFLSGLYHNDWIRIEHMLVKPFYTAGYITSAVAALQIWNISQNDEEEAVAAFLAMIRQDQNQPFMMLLKNASLKPPHDPAVLREIAERAEQTLTEPQAADKAA